MRLHYLPRSGEASRLEDWVQNVQVSKYHSSPAQRSKAGSQFLWWTRNMPFSSSYLDLVQDLAAVAFQCNVVSKALFEKQTNKHWFQSLGIRFRCLTLTITTSVRMPTLPGPIPLALCYVDMHFLWLCGEDSTLRMTWTNTWSVWCSYIVENYLDI